MHRGCHITEDGILQKPQILHKNCKVLTRFSKLNNSNVHEIPFSCSHGVTECNNRISVIPSQVCSRNDVNAFFFAFCALHNSVSMLPACAPVAVKSMYSFPVIALQHVLIEPPVHESSTAVVPSRTQILPALPLHHNLSRLYDCMKSIFIVWLVWISWSWYDFTLSASKVVLCSNDDVK
jgi:hypothetical protein